MTRHFQFSLRALLAVTTLASVTCAATFSRHSAWSGAVIILAMLAIPGGLWAGAASARGYARAFMIGAGVPSMIGLWLTTNLIPVARAYEGSETPISTMLWFGLEDFASVNRLNLALVVAAVLVGGAAGVLAHWITVASNRE